MTQTAIDLLKTQRDAARAQAEALASDLSPIIQDGQRAQERVNRAWQGVSELDDAIAALEKDRDARAVVVEGS